MTLFGINPLLCLPSPGPSGGNGGSSVRITQPGFEPSPAHLCAANATWTPPCQSSADLLTKSCCAKEKAPESLGSAMQRDDKLLCFTLTSLGCGSLLSHIHVGTTCMIFHGARVFPMNLISGCSMEHPRGTLDLKAQRFLKCFCDHFSFL